MFKFLEKIFNINQSKPFTGVDKVYMLDGPELYIAYYEGMELGWAFNFYSNMVCTCTRGNGDTFKTEQEAKRILSLYLSQNRKES